jgi:YVTN family beta-propeller protein
MRFLRRTRADTVGRRRGKALGPVMGAGVGLLLASGLLPASSSPAPAPSAIVSPAVGGHVYVTNQLDDTVSVIDVRMSKVVATVTVGSSPYGVAASP